MNRRIFNKGVMINKAGFYGTEWRIQAFHFFIIR
jgi:hypothetical protein